MLVCPLRFDGCPHAGFLARPQRARGRPHNVQVRQPVCSVSRAVTEKIAATMHCGMGLAGKANYASRKIPQALAYFRQALAHGEDPRVHAFERWACWMMLGKFECAWMEADRSEPPWKGDIRSPRHLLIRCLRGLGDAIQF